MSGITSELLDACKLDNRKAINRLYEHCFHKLMPICFQYYSNEEDARSALNIGFIKILKGLESVETEAVNFAAWSKRIMVNTLIDEYRKKKSYASVIFPKATEAELDYEYHQTTNNAESSFGFESIMNLVRQLPDTTQKVFTLYVVEGYSHREIGEILSISEGTSKWHLSSGRKILRQKLELIENYYQRMVI